MLTTKSAIMHSNNKLHGKNIAVLFPAWTNCGSYHVWAGQISAYKELGANVFPVALSMTPNATPENISKWKEFLSSASEIRDFCYLGGPPYYSLINYYYLRHVLWPYFHGNHPRIRTWLISQAILPSRIENQNFDLIHCNLFFAMPVARRLALGNTPILLETIDIQARQFEIMNRLSWCLKPKISYEELLAEELEQLEYATALLHLNSEEKSAFEKLLPTSKHFLLYPRVNKVEAPSNPEETIMIAANNPANIESVNWLLTQVAPKVPKFDVSIYGNVDKGFSKYSPGLYDHYRSCFKGEVKSVEIAYKKAKAIILPTFSGHGISIKAAEALSTGLPIIATSKAFRGMSDQSLKLNGLTIADCADSFAEALRQCLSNETTSISREAISGSTIEYYNNNFSHHKYCANLEEIAGQFL